MLLAKTAEFLHLNPVGIVLLILERVVIPLLAIVAA